MSDDKVQVLKRSVLLRTVEGEQLLLLAQKIEVGSTMTYAQVKDEIGVDLQSSAGRQLWTKAQRHLAAERSMQFSCVHKVGYKRLDDDGKVHKSGRHIGQAVGRVRAASRVLHTTDRNNLSNEKRLAFDVQSMVVGEMQNAAKPAIIATRAQPPSPEQRAALLESFGKLG